MWPSECCSVGLSLASTGSQLDSAIRERQTRVELEQVAGLSHFTMVTHAVTDTGEAAYLIALAATSHHHTSRLALDLEKTLVDLLILNTAWK